jgi:hypothetical protein
MPQFKEAIEVYPMRAFNSWWMDVTKNLNPDQYVQHIMARSIEKKVEIMEKEYDRLKGRYPILEYHLNHYAHATTTLPPVR